MRALVAGGAGFVGSHLCDRLLAEDASVVCVDNLLTGSETNVQHLKGHPNFQFIQHDCSQPLDLSVDLVFHLASPASPNPANPRSYVAHPVETALVNSLGTYQLLELARRNSAGFLFASSSEVYGDPLEHPQKESYWGNVNPIGIRSCYDEGKRFGEALTMAYVHAHHVDARIVRLFNIYGPRFPLDGRLVPNFVAQAVAGEPMTVHGDGSQTRSFCYISDLVEALWRTMRNPRARGEVLNLGSPDEHSVLEYAVLIRDLCHSRSEIVHTAGNPDDPGRRRPDISRAKAVLGWEPHVSLPEGLKGTIAWYRERYVR